MMEEEATAQEPEQVNDMQVETCDQCKVLNDAEAQAEEEAEEADGEADEDAHPKVAGAAVNVEEQQAEVAVAAELDEKIKVLSYRSHWVGVQTLVTLPHITLPSHHPIPLHPLPPAGANRRHGAEGPGQELARGALRLHTGM